MPVIRDRVSCPLFDSFRVQQVAGMFDVPIANRLSESFRANVPGVGEPWEIGLIVGPSGSGKTTIARRAFGPFLASPAPWPEDRAVVDCMGDLPIRAITRIFSAVGFGSPVAWIKPYAALSGGERFRCDLARAFARAVSSAGGERPVVAFDEFTSVVDRTVAKIGSVAIAKAIRTASVRARFVGITCHYDVARWLEPDWVVDMVSGRCSRRRLRRPKLRAKVYRCSRDAWRLFARHHYLAADLSPGARCYVATWNDAPVSFCAMLPAIGKRNHWRISRLVTLPDYQGAGFGMGLAEAVADLTAGAGANVSITASHPAVIAHCWRSPRWRTGRVAKCGSRSTRASIGGYRGAARRAVVSFHFVRNSEAT